MLWAGCSAAAPRDEELFVRPEDQHTVIFGSLDAGRSVFVSGGAKQTVTGPLDRPGFVVMESSGFGLTRERIRGEGGSVAVDRLKHEGAVLAGYQTSLGPVFLSGFVGPEVAQEQLAYDGRLRRVSQPRFGARAQIELWAHPIPELLVTGTVVAGTTHTSVWARGSTGIQVAPGTFLGPEVTVYTTPTYTEKRWGVHVTGFGIGIVTMRLSAGWMTDDAHRTGAPYVGLSAWMRL